MAPPKKTGSSHLKNLLSCREEYNFWGVSVVFFSKLQKATFGDDAIWIAKQFSLESRFRMSIKYYYSFKIFLRFWLAKIPRTIHHNQLVSTKFGRRLRYVKNDVNRAANCQIIELLAEKTWERGWVVLEVSKKMAEHFSSFTRNK